MAFSITYRKLFEVRIIHRYLLQDDAYFLDQESAHLEAVDYDIREYIQIEPNSDCQTILKDQRMVFKQTALGFVVFVEAVETAEGVFAPFVKLKPEQTLTFSISTPNPYFHNLTNIRLKPNIPGIYHFDNFHNKIEDRYPSLANPYTEILTRKYEMGEVIQGSVMANTATDTDMDNMDIVAEDWDSFPDHKYATYNDRLLLSSRFPYRFSLTDNSGISDPDFILFDSNGISLETLSLTDGQPIDQHLLDFSHLTSGRYRLQIEKGNYYFDQKELFINDDLYDDSVWGIIQINDQSDASAFRLLDADQNLQSPVFEIRLLNRPTYWRYIGQEADTFLPNPDFDVDGNPSNHLITSSPRQFTRKFQALTYNGVLLPNPSAPFIHGVGEDKIYSEIYLPKITF